MIDMKPHVSTVLFGSFLYPPDKKDKCLKKHNKTNSPPKKKQNKQHIQCGNRPTFHPSTNGAVAVGRAR